jgi:hypothetical protein
MAEIEDSSLFLRLNVPLGKQAAQDFSFYRFERHYSQLVDGSAGNSWGFVGLLDQLLERR